MRGNMIKKFVPFFIVLVFLAGCTQSPESVAKKFYQSISERDFDTAKQYSTARVHTMLSLMANMGSDKSFQEAGKAEISNCKIEGDVANCDVTLPNNKKDKIRLVKVAGKWKVDIRK